VKDVAWAWVALSSVWTAFCILDGFTTYRAWRISRRSESAANNASAAASELAMKETMLFASTVKRAADSIRRDCCSACRDRDSVY